MVDMPENQSSSLINDVLEALTMCNLCPPFTLRITSHIRYKRF